MTGVGPVRGYEKTRGLVLVTGASGYIGGRLVPRLLQSGYRVRCLVRDPQRLRERTWADSVEVVRGDVTATEEGSLGAAFDGVEAAYYLVHSMMGGEGYRERDLLAARSFARGARRAGVRRLVYLGGLGDPAAELSPHLRSRQETGEELRREGPPVTEFRAAVVVGAGSVSFEMIRYLTERLPVMICPRWVYTRAQPIAADDVLSYLVATLEQPASAGRVIEIGGVDILTYGQMMMGYARARGLSRRLIAVPVLTPRLSSYWVHFVTPIPSTIAAQLFPDIRPVSYQEAVRRALGSLHAGAVETSWSDSLASSEGDLTPVTLTSEAGMTIERRQQQVAASTDEVFAVFASLGGERGWPYAEGLWRLRGAMDRLVGGVGMRRGRRDPHDLRPGDAIDFWRVEDVQPGSLLRLRAEMKVPGNAWLQFEAKPLEDARTLLVQTAFFAPKGLGGLAYWYGLYPVHRAIFSGMVRRLAEEAEEGSRLRTEIGRAFGLSEEETKGNE